MLMVMYFGVDFEVSDYVVYKGLMACRTIVSLWYKNISSILQREMANYLPMSISKDHKIENKLDLFNPFIYILMTFVFPLYSE